VTPKDTATHTLGLDISKTSVKAALISWEKDSPQIQRLSEEIISSSDEASFEQALYEACHKAIGNLGEALLVTSTSIENLIVRSVSLKLQREKDVDAVLRFQVEPQLPYPLEEAILDKVIIEQKKGAHSVLVLSLHSDSLQQHLNQMHSLDLEPEAVCCPPIALANFANCFGQAEKPFIVIHQEELTTTCVLVKEGKLTDSHFFNIGLHHFSQALAKDNNITHKEASLLLLGNPPATFNESKAPNFHLIANKLEKELAKTLKAMAMKNNIPASPPAILTGSSSFLPLVIKTIETINIPEKYRYFAVPIGLALEFLPNKTSPINFRQKEFAYPHPWRRIKKTLIFFGALCLALTLGSLFLSHLMLNEQRHEIGQRYAETLTLLESSYKRESSQQAPLPFSDKALTKGIRQLEKRVRTAANTFLLTPDVPSVSELLNWLNQLPTPLRSDNEEDMAPVKIEKLTYNMTTRPQQDKMKATYGVKVEIEFFIATPQAARKIRDLLKEPNFFIDPNSELTWTENRDKYRASFFLQNNKRDLDNE